MRRRRAAGRSRREPALDAAEILRIAEPKVFMAHALAARQERVRELLGIHRDVTAHVLEPFHGVARRVLQPQGLGHPLVLVAGEGAGRVRCLAERAGEGDRVASPLTLVHAHDDGLEHPCLPISP
jgi:hypothetical protein